MGIIGVVAAMTMPTLMTKVKESVIKQKFKKSYAMLNNVVRQVANEEGLMCAYYEKGSSVSKTGDCSEFFKAIPKYTKVIKTCKNKALESGCIPKYESWVTSSGCTGFSNDNVNNRALVYVFIDGTILIRYSGGNMPLFLLDVNGFDGPNKPGKDLFSFHLFTDEYAGNTYITAGTCMPGKTTSQMMKEVFGH